MSFKLTDEEKKLIIDRREQNKIEQQKKDIENERRRLKSTPAEKLTHQELLERVKLQDMEQYIKDAERRIINHNNSGDWSWDKNEDLTKLREAYWYLGREIPVCNW